MVGSSDNDAAEGVAGALEEASLAEGVVAGIFAHYGGNNELDRVVLYGLVYEAMPVVAAISCTPVPKFGSLIGCHLQPCERANEDHGRVVEAVLAGGDELLPDGLGREMGVCAHCAEVGDDEEDAFGLLSYLLWTRGGGGD